MASQPSGGEGDESPPGVQIDLDRSTDSRDLSGEDLFLEFRRLQRENERLKQALIRRETDERKRLKLEERPFPNSVQPDDLINQQELLKVQVREANGRARSLEVELGKLKTNLERIMETVFRGSDAWGYGNTGPYTDSQGEEGETYPNVDIKRDLSDEEDSQYDDQSIEIEGNSEEIADNQEENNGSEDNQMDDTQAGSEDSQEMMVSSNSQDTRPSASTSNDNHLQVILPSTSRQLSSFRVQSTPRASTSVVRSSARLHKKRFTSTLPLPKYSKKKRRKLPATDKTQQPHQDNVNKGQQEEKGSAQDESTDKHNEETEDTPTVNQDNHEGTAASNEETSNQSMTEESIESTQGTERSPSPPKTDPDSLYQQQEASSSSTPHCSTRFFSTRRTSTASRPTSRRRGNLSSSTPSFIPRYAKRKPDKPHAVDKKKLHLGWYCICKSSFKNQGRLSEHIRYFNGDAKFNCEYCPLRFVQLSLLKKHWQTAHKRTFPAGTIGCGDCGGVFTDKEAHKAHRLAMHNKAKNEPRENHAEDKHATELGLFKCICGKSFAIRSYMVTHLRDKTNAHEFRCKECPGSFKTLARLQSHSKVVHKNLAVEKGTYGCGICGELFPVRKMHQQHMQKIHNVISWPLTEDPTAPPKVHGPVALTPNSKGQAPARFFQRCLCGAAFANKKLLTRHIQQKRPKVPFKCPHCFVEYRNHSRLKKHIIQIHGKTEYTGVGCTFCGRVFTTAVARRQHHDREHPK